MRDTRYVELRDSAVRALRRAVDAFQAHDFGLVVDVIEEESWIIRELDQHPTRGLAFDRPSFSDQEHQANAA